MRGITEYLKKFKHIEPPERTVREVFISTVYSVCGISLKNHEVSLQYQTIFLHCNPIVKNEVLLRRGEILRVCQEGLLGKRSIREIR